jgi:hypothetical protein
LEDTFVSYRRASGHGGSFDSPPPGLRWPQRGFHSSLPGLGGGLAIGIGLAFYSLRKTRFENTAQGLFYTPSAAPAPGQDPSLSYATTPLTMLVFGVLAGYYVAYAIGLLRWKASIANDPPASGPLA